jgi:hypothetical protein
MEKSGFSGFEAVCFRSKNLLATAPAIDPIDPPLTHFVQAGSSLKVRKFDWRKPLRGGCGLISAEAESSRGWLISHNYSQKLSCNYYSLLHGFNMVSGWVIVTTIA